uniref:PTS system mannose/fructose/N-acetylgalactosamine-transporter subunit IIB n=1 Tax=Ndongobacter massiliensis TaxID=1871025 RepID=UPI0009311DEB|nr:PTS sugar transporter subunit IIB [Ndongobacter massiliensis]
MNNICLARVDFRLLHGQIVTNWIQQVNADSILIVNDQLMNDPILANVFRMAAPPGIQVALRTIDKAIQDFNLGKFKNRKLIILFKTVEDAYSAINQGMELQFIQIGGLGSDNTKRKISNEIFLSENEMSKLKLLHSKGVEISFQVTPKDTKLNFEDVEKIFGK